MRRRRLPFNITTTHKVINQKNTENCLCSVLFCSALGCLLTQCQAAELKEILRHILFGFWKIFISYVRKISVGFLPLIVIVFVLIPFRGLSAAAQMFTNLSTRFRANNIQCKYQVTAISHCKLYIYMYKCHIINWDKRSPDNSRTLKSIGLLPASCYWNWKT